MAELLAPAGSFESLCAAVCAGADAVYIGGSRFGARAYADNPSEDLLLEGINYCHLHGKKLYLTVNTLLKERELEEQLGPWLLPYYENGLDAVIVQDLGVVRFIQEHYPDLEIHASTQMTITGPDGAAMMKSLGIPRVVPARELSLAEVREIIQKTGIEVETFIHGAMCYSYSGQCLFSSLLGGRSGNRGRCAQPCRLPYRRLDTKKETSGCLLSMKDMCTLDLIPDLIDTGIASLKIEGRMKRPEYTAGVVSIYRKYLDLYAKKGRKGYRVEEEDRRILMDLYNRGGFSDGYYHRHNGAEMMAMDRPNHLGTQACRITGSGKGRIYAKALEDLHPKDVLELRPGREITLTQSVRSGRQFELAASVPGLKNGQIICRTKNETLLQELAQKYIHTKCKEKIKGDLKILSDGCAILKLECRNALVEVSGCIGETAQSNPTTVSSIEKQMRRMGNTPFEFASLQISAADGLFVPVSRLNELRRKGAARLEERLLALAGHGRKREEIQADVYEDGSRSDLQRADCESDNDLSAQADPCENRKHRLSQTGEQHVTVLVTESAQLEALFAYAKESKDWVCEKLASVYLDAQFLDDPNGCAQYAQRIQAFGWQCFLSFPPVFRRKELELFGKADIRSVLRRMDGFLLHTADEAAWIQRFLTDEGMQAVLVGDDTLYAYNNRAAAFWNRQGIRRRTLPAELNVHELADLPMQDAELIVYGYQPLMQSAQCVVKNTSGCDQSSRTVRIQDRKGAVFFVRSRCLFCCSTVYNSVPLELGGCMQEIGRLSPAFLRLSFTVETYEETLQVLQRYAKASVPGKAVQFSGTRGHFKRGVE